jgi:hypothetical protein
MAMTLIEAAKAALNGGEAIRSAIIEMFAESSELLRVMPFETIQGAALRGVREETLPDATFRGVNEAYTSSTGKLSPVVEPLTIAGGDLDVDSFIVRTMGANQRTIQERMQVKAIAHRITKAFLKGDNATDNREPDGLQARLTGTQKISAGSTSGGTALSLLKLDELIDSVDQPTHLIMNRTMRRLLTQAARTTTIGGFITWTKDEFGRQVAMYNGLPILLVDQDNQGTDIMQFTEAASAGGSTATSIYCASFTEGNLYGIQQGPMIVQDFGELQSEPKYRTRVEWYPGLFMGGARSAARLWSIANATVTA